MEMIAQSTFNVIPGVFVYAKVRTVRSDEHHFLITKDADEITVVTTADKTEELDLIERNKDDYCLIAMNVSVPFYSIGFLATVGDAFAKRGINILIVSTYSRDYLLVRHDLLAQAKEILSGLGFGQGQSGACERG